MNIERNPDPELRDLWRMYVDAVREREQVCETDENRLYDKIVDYGNKIEATEAKTADDIAIQLRYALCEQVRVSMPDGYYSSIVLNTLSEGQVKNIKVNTETKLLWNLVARYDQILCTDIGDISRHLDCAIVDTEAGIGVLTALVDGYCTTGEDVSSEAVTWLAAKIAADIKQLSAAVDAYQSAARR